MTLRRHTSCDWLRPDDRILITGSSGWFGRTLTDMIKRHPQVLPIGSPREPKAIQWRDDIVRQFAPTVVANFAFNTRDRLQGMRRAEFIEENRELTRRLIFALGLDGVRIGLTISSGASLSPDAEAGDASAEIYGYLKAQEEDAALSMASTHLNVVVARVYSVSGPFVRRVHEYAFSDFVAQAIRGTVTIRSSQPVFRRYVAVRDLLSISLGSGAAGWSGVIESGGDLVEMQELAEAITAVVNPKATIIRGELERDEPSVYASDNRTWIEACDRTGVLPQTLHQQVRAVERYLKGLPASPIPEPGSAATEFP